MKTRSDIVVRRTYARTTNEEETTFESWADICERVRGHQQWLWERQLDRDLVQEELDELIEFKEMMVSKVVSTSGRTLWLGGTPISKVREASQFNCAGTVVETVYDIVDVLWLLMQGTGVGFKPVVGTLNGFNKVIPKISTIRSTRTAKGGEEDNTESWDSATGIWTITVGDSAEAWSKSIGKLLAGKYPAKELILDFSQLRPAGERLKGYGWISSGDSAISKAYLAISKIMNRKAGELLSRIDILDVVNWLGTILSSRRSAQIALFDYGEQEWEEFSLAKREYWVENEQRVQSNNSLLFSKKPTEKELEHIFGLMADGGGSEPAFINAEEARNRAPWFKTCNPCVEILLGNKAFCNLVEIDISKFRGNTTGLLRVLTLAARANYRQTCVNLKDGVLQEAWHLNNEFLRLCGVGLTGISQREDLSSYDLETMKRVATNAAYSMAEELGTQIPKNVTCVKPSGTLSKVMMSPEGIHKPLGKYIFNNINFGKSDPLLPILREAGYRVYPNPNSPEEGVLVTFPIKWDNIEFDKVINSKGEVLEVNNETAIQQLDRYKKYQIHWCQQNVSNTISYSPDEVPKIIKWFLRNWDIYVGVSFLYRADPSKSAEDLGYLYLPQEVVTKEKYDAYANTLSAIELNAEDSLDNELESQEVCVGGMCPVK